MIRAGRRGYPPAWRTRNVAVFEINGLLFRCRRQVQGTLNTVQKRKCYPAHAPCPNRWTASPLSKMCSTKRVATGPRFCSGVRAAAGRMKQSGFADLVGVNMCTSTSVGAGACADGTRDEGNGSMTPGGCFSQRVLSASAYRAPRVRLATRHCWGPRRSPRGWVLFSGEVWDWQLAVAPGGGAVFGSMASARSLSRCSR
jgi:hypothetical protein